MKKKALLGLLPVTGALLTPLAMVSCGETRFHQEDDGKIVISTGFSSNNAQGNGIKYIVDAYNEWIKGKESEGYLPVDLRYTPGGYKTDTLSKKLENKDTKTFYNILVNYPAAASIIAVYKMNLAISDETYNGLGILPSFAGVNSLVAGNSETTKTVDGQEVKSFNKWVIPFSKSSEMASVDMVLLGKLLSELNETFGISIDENNSEKIKKYIKHYKDTEGDRNFVDKEWNQFKFKEASKEKVEKAIKAKITTLSDDQFKSYDALLKLCIAMKYMYPTAEKSIIGFDSLSNAVNAMAVSISEGNLENYYVTPDSKQAKTGGWDFESFYTNPESKQYKLVKTISDLIIEAINTRALWVGGDGSYGSNYLVNHNLAISLGSTAGYKHTYSQGSEKVYQFAEDTNIKNHFGKNDIYEILSLGEGDTVVKFSGDFGDHTNNIKKANVEASNVGRYDKQAATAEAEELLKSYVGKGYILPVDPSNKDLVKEANGDKLVVNGIAVEGSKFLGKILAGQQAEANCFFIPKSKIVEAELSPDQTVNESDADWLSVPFTKTASANKKAIVSQGPSFIPIHANAKEDKATELFIKWAFTTMDKLKFGNITYKNMKPVDAFNKFGHYISPTSDFFGLPETDSAIKNLDPASKLAYDAFKKTLSDNNYLIAEDVASPVSNNIRQAFTAAATSLASDANSGKPVTFIDFISKIKSSLVK